MGAIATHARRHRRGADAAAEGGGAHRPHARHRRHRHRRRRGRARCCCCPTSAAPADVDHRAAARRVAGGGGGARRPAGDPVGGAGAGRAAHGQAQRHRQEAVVGGDAGLGLGDLLGQDRHADALRDDDRARHDGLGRQPRHRRRLRAARAACEHEGSALAPGPLHAEHDRGAERRQPGRQRRPAPGAPTAPGRSRATRPKRRSWWPSASSACTSGASGASSASARSRSPPSAR